MFLLVKVILTALASTTVHVSRQGSDLPISGRGSLNSPFLSLTEAVRNLHSGDTLMLHRGDTFHEPLVLNGLAGPGTTLVGAFGTGPSPVLSGARRYEGWSRQADGIWISEWHERVPPWIPRSQGARWAQWPGGEWALASTGSEGDHLVGAMPAGVAGGVVLTLPATFCHAWDTLGSMDESGGRIRFSQSFSGPLEGRKLLPGMKYKLQGHRSLLLQEGDWTYQDRNLLFCSTKRPEVEVATLRCGVELRQAGNVVVEDLDIANFAVMGVFASGRGVVLRRLRIHGIGQSGMFLEGRGIHVDSCDFIDMRTNGIESYAESTLIHGGSIREVDLEPGWPGGAPTSALGTGITIRGANSEVRGVRLEGIGYDAIKSTGEGSSIVGNDISEFCRTLEDGGGIYLSGARTQGSRVDSNRIDGERPSGGESGGVYLRIVAGIYLDEGARNCRISGNRVVGGGRGIFLHNSSWNTVERNRIEGSVHYGIALEEDFAAADSMRENLVEGNEVREAGEGLVRVKKLNGSFPAATIRGNTYMAKQDGFLFSLESKKDGVHPRIGWTDWTRAGFDGGSKCLQIP